MTTIDILQLIDRLEELVERGHRLPFGNGVSIDHGAFLDIIDQMRITVPQEIKRCQEIEQERDRIIAKAHKDARRLMAEAREEADIRLDEHEIRKKAEADAARMLEAGRQEAEEIRRGADEYAVARLRELNRYVQQLAHIIDNGLSALEPAETEQSESSEAESRQEPLDEAGLSGSMVDSDLAGAAG